MADIKISGLVAATALSPTDEFETNQSGVSRKATGAQISVLVPRGYIDGLKMVRVSGTALTVTTGSAYIQSLGRAVDVATDIAKTGLSLTASVWYHVYLYLNAGVPDVEIVTTAPAASYSGTARSKTGDTSRRYVGSVKSDSGANLYNFQHTGDYIAYRNGQNASPFRILANGTATAETTVSAAEVAPVTSTAAQVRLLNTASSGTALTGTSEDSVSGGGGGGTGIGSVTVGQQAAMLHPLDASQTLTYWYQAAPTGTGLYIDVYGYQFGR